MSINIGVIGNSHIYCIKKAHQLRTESAHLTNTHHFTFLSLQEKQYYPTVIKTPDTNEKVLNPIAYQDMVNFIQGVDVIVSCIGGSAHDVLALVNHPVPYDFYFDSPNVAIDQRVLIPRSAIKLLLAKRMSTFLIGLETLAAVSKVKVLHLESPPPIPSEQHILNNARSFTEQALAYGITPANIRKKMWELQAEIAQEKCASLNIDYIACPAEALSAEGMLNEQAWLDDPNHANHWYGERVLKQIESLLSR